jgi:ParB-like nuclease domain
MMNDKIERLSPYILTPHPLNEIIYGSNEDISSLIRSIENSRWIEPIVITTEYVIVSGHRRARAAKELGWETVPVDIREFWDPIAIVEMLLLENVSRDRTVESRLREGMAWEGVEVAKARLRKGTRTDLTNIVENFPPCSVPKKFGKSRDAIGKKIGLSGRSYTKGKKVIETIDLEASQGNQQHVSTLRSTLSKSIDGAYKLAIRPPELREAISELVSEGKVRSVNAAISFLGKQGEHTAQQTRSCWNCQHRDLALDNQSIYCNKFGILNLIYQSGEERGRNCPQWNDKSSPQETRLESSFALQLLLPTEWQKLITEKAYSSVADLPARSRMGRQLNFHLRCVFGD